MRKLCKKCGVETARAPRGDCKVCAQKYRAEVRAVGVTTEARIAEVRKNNPQLTRLDAIKRLQKKGDDMKMTLANRKWNQGYYLPWEQVARDAAVHCRDCSYKLQTSHLRCNFSGPSGRFPCNPGGTCKHATAEDPDLIGLISDE